MELLQHVDSSNQNMAGTDREKTCRNRPEVLTLKRWEMCWHSCFELLVLMVKANETLKLEPAVVPVPHTPEGEQE